MNRPGLLHFLFLKSILTIGVSKPQHILIRRCWNWICNRRFQKILISSHCFLRCLDYFD